MSVSCEDEVYVTSRSFVQRSPTECGVSSVEELHTGGLGPTGLLSHGKKIFNQQERGVD
jgi:hypothetical protein